VENKGNQLTRGEVRERGSDGVKTLKEQRQKEKITKHLPGYSTGTLPA
jgi:hypothetical protein